MQAPAAKPGPPIHPPQVPHWFVALVVSGVSGAEIAAASTTAERQSVIETWFVETKWMGVVYSGFRMVL